MSSHADQQIPEQLLAPSRSTAKVLTSAGPPVRKTKAVAFTEKWQAEDPAGFQKWLKETFEYANTDKSKYLREPRDDEDHVRTTPLRHAMLGRED